MAHPQTPLLPRTVPLDLPNPHSPPRAGGIPKAPPKWGGTFRAAFQGPPLLLRGGGAPQSAPLPQIWGRGQRLTEQSYCLKLEGSGGAPQTSASCQSPLRPRCHPSLYWGDMRGRSWGAQPLPPKLMPDTPGVPLPRFIYWTLGGLGGGHTPIHPPGHPVPPIRGDPVYIGGGCLWVLLFDAVGVGRDTPKLPSPSAPPPNTTETKDGGHKVTPTTPTILGWGLKP